MSDMLIRYMPIFNLNVTLKFYEKLQRFIFFMVGTEEGGRAICVGELFVYEQESKINIYLITG